MDIMDVMDHGSESNASNASTPSIWKSFFMIFHPFSQKMLKSLEWKFGNGCSSVILIFAAWDLHLCPWNRRVAPRCSSSAAPAEVPQLRFRSIQIHSDPFRFQILQIKRSWSLEIVKISRDFVISSNGLGEPLIMLRLLRVEIVKKLFVNQLNPWAPRGFEKLWTISPPLTTSNHLSILSESHIGLDRFPDSGPECLHRLWRKTVDWWHLALEKGMPWKCQVDPMRISVVFFRYHRYAQVAEVDLRWFKYVHNLSIHPQWKTAKELDDFRNWGTWCNKACREGSCLEMRSSHAGRQPWCCRLWVGTCLVHFSDTVCTKVCTKVWGWRWGMEPKKSTNPQSRRWTISHCHWQRNRDGCAERSDATRNLTLGYSMQTLTNIYTAGQNSVLGPGPAFITLIRDLDNDRLWMEFSAFWMVETCWNMLKHYKEWDSWIDHLSTGAGFLPSTVS